MKKYKLIIVLFSLVLLTGCSSSKLEKYLSKEDYKCQKSVCYRKDAYENIQTLEKTFDINNNKYFEKETFNIPGSQGYDLEYDWSTFVIKGKYYLPTASFEVFLNVKDDNSFECNSDDEDKLYVKAECIGLKEKLKTVASKVDEIIKNNQ